MEELIKAVLNRIRDELERQYWNKYQKDMASPFFNVGAIYSNNTFTVRSYDWNGNYQPNFEYKDFKVWWYKHSNRGINWKYQNKENGMVSSEFLAQMIIDCFEAIDKDFRGEK